MSEANKDLVRRHVEEIVAEEYVEHAVAPFGTTAPGTVPGPSAARETAQWLRAQFPDLRMEIQSIVADGDMVAVRMLSEGTNLGKLGGVVKAPGPPAFVRATQRVRGAVRAQA